MLKYFSALKKIPEFFRPANRKNDDRPLMERLRDKYTLKLYSTDHEEVFAYEISFLGLYILISSLVVVTALLVTFLIIYTPLKRYIPGYGDLTRDNEVALLTNKVRNLENEIEAVRVYNENFKKILTGDIASLSQENVEKNTSAKPLSDSAIKEVARIPEEDALRSSVAAGKITSAQNAVQNSGISIGKGSDIPLEQLFFIPPVTGETTAPFNPEKSHFGVDISATKNAAVKAAADGVVISAGFTVETGHTIAIQHPNNVVTMYKHNSVVLKKEGSPVKAGEAVAIVGNTGEQSTGPHLHFELWYKGRPVDPTDYIYFQ